MTPDEAMAQATQNQLESGRFLVKPRIEQLAVWAIEKGENLLHVYDDVVRDPDAFLVPVSDSAIQTAIDMLIAEGWKVTKGTVAVTSKKGNRVSKTCWTITLPTRSKK